MLSSRGAFISLRGLVEAQCGILLACLPLFECCLPFRGYIGVGSNKSGSGLDGFRGRLSNSAHATVNLA